jgi:beta-lactamase regulating signal transducer with metallopeptidase domain
MPALPLLSVSIHAFGSESTRTQSNAPAEPLTPRNALRDGNWIPKPPFLGAYIENPQHPRQNAADLPVVISSCTLCLYLATVLFALSRLAWGLKKTQALLDSAEAVPLGRNAHEAWESCLTWFGITKIKLMSSRKLAAPATVSWPAPIVLLPAEFRGEQANDITAVFCHELAHVRRKDFLSNIVIETLGVLLFYHPAFHWIRRRIHETRELACDDMAADAMSGRHVYARSLLRLAEKMLSAADVPQPGCALGIFEGEVLEKRIMNLLKNRSKHAHLRAFTSLALGSLLLLATCVLSANLGLRLVNAQSATAANNPPAGWHMSGSKPASYQSSVDRGMIRNGQPSASLKSIAPVTDGFGTLMQSISASDYAGKRVRLRAWVRAQDVDDWAGVWMRVDKASSVEAFDNMQSRAIKGTQSWRQCDVVLDVPADATGIFYGILLSGSGEVWMNDVSFEVVGKEVPVTGSPLAPNLPAHPTNLKFTQ